MAAQKERLWRAHRSIKSNINIKKFIKILQHMDIVQHASKVTDMMNTNTNLDPLESGIKL